MDLLPPALMITWMMSLVVDTYNARTAQVLAVWQMKSSPGSGCSCIALRYALWCHLFALIWFFSKSSRPSWQIFLHPVLFTPPASLYLLCWPPGRVGIILVNYMAWQVQLGTHEECLNPIDVSAFKDHGVSYFTLPWILQIFLIHLIWNCLSLLRCCQYHVQVTQPYRKVVSTTVEHFIPWSDHCLCWSHPHVVLAFPIWAVTWLSILGFWDRTPPPPPPPGSKIYPLNCSPSIMIIRSWNGAPSLGWKSASVILMSMVCL